MKKLGKNKKWYIIISVISVFAIVNLVVIQYKLVHGNEQFIGAYINGKYSETLPSKGSGYAVEKIVCENNKNASWDYDKWGIKFSAWNSKDRCNIYFNSLETFKIANKTFYLDEMHKCPSIDNGGFLTVTNKEDKYGYLCKAKDNYGDSYYYRGTVTNNYVKFGSWESGIVYGYYSESSSSYRKYYSMDACQNASSYNKKCTVIREENASMYWRIIRINGDGTVRVIYDGTSAHANGDDSEDRQIGEVKFNEPWRKDDYIDSVYAHTYDDNAGVGYKYGNRDGVVERQIGNNFSTYESSKTYYISKEYVYSNGEFSMKDPIGVLGSAMTNDYIGYYTFNSTSAGGSSKQMIYKITNISLNSRGTKVDYKYLLYGTTSKEQAQMNTNSSEIKRYIDDWYYDNISGTSDEQYVMDNIFCNDRSLNSDIPNDYTNNGYGLEPTAYRLYNLENNSIKKMTLTCLQKNDAFTVNDTVNGNGALEYEVGLITADEVILSGGWYSDNPNYYLYTGNNYWTMSPSYFDGERAEAYYVFSPGDISSILVNGEYGARPVLNLSADILNNGSGTKDDPYHV